MYSDCVVIIVVKIPLDAIWSDIDYMDEVSYCLLSLKAYVP